MEVLAEREAKVVMLSPDTFYYSFTQKIVTEPVVIGKSAKP